MSLGFRESLVIGILCLLAASIAAPAQTASLVKDINTVPYAPYDSSPDGFTEFNGAVYFFASASPGDFGLWRTEGTGAGTQLVKSGLIGVELLVSGGILYLVAADGTHGVELWKSDGTEAGTVIVKDINPGPGNGLRPGLVDFNGTLYFSADDGLTGSELWRSDGTAAGTILVKDIEPDQSSLPVGLTAVGDALFFAATSETSGTELWKSDGTAQGTILVKDIRPGTDWSSPNSMVNAGGKLLFRADDGVNGRELWRSDGTPGGTIMVRDINPGVGSSSQDLFDARLVEMDGMAFFSANSGDGSGPGLWKSDGTMEGTQQVISDLVPTAFQVLGSTLYFLQLDIDGFLSTPHLWKTDGSTPGTELVKSFDGSIERQLAAVGNVLFFAAHTEATGRELWKSDGTGPGTILVKDIQPGPDSSSFPVNLVGIGDSLYFSARTEANGQEPWISNGTANGTQLLKDIGIAPGSSIANTIVQGNGRLYFAATDGTSGVELWATDGSAEGTSMVKDINPGTDLAVYPDEMLSHNGSLLFSANDGSNGFELWRSNGTKEGTVMVKDIHPGPNESAFPTDLTELNGAVVFAATDVANGNELWRSDGTSAGTMLLKNIAPGNASSFPVSLTRNGNRVFFIADNAVAGSALWKTDGTTAGTILVKDVHPSNQEDFYFELVSSGGLVYFRADVGEGHQLWRSDGTSAGTFAIHLITPSGPLFTAAGLTDVNGTLFFFQGDELWKSDGTKEGTTLVKDINFTATPPSNPGRLANWEGHLYFSVIRGNSPELWRSDGTEAGTVRVKEFNTDGVGSIHFGPEIIGQAGGAMFLSVATKEGYQLWRSHGTDKTTTAIPNIHLGPVGPMASLGSNIYFVGQTKAIGREMWTAPLLPAISSEGVVDAAGFRPTLAPGSLASLFGAELSTTTEAAQSLPLPTSLAGARVQVNGIDAPLLFVSPKQINFQIPFEVPAGAASVVAVLGEQQSPGEPTTVAGFAPGLFVNPSTGDPIVQRHPDGALITAQNPATPGDILILYITGIGGLDNPPSTGSPATDSPLASATLTPTVTLGGVEVEVLFAGLAPGFVGLGQINVKLPAGLPQGNPQPLVIRFGESESQTLQLPF